MNVNSYAVLNKTIIVRSFEYVEVGLNQTFRGGIGFFSMRNLNLVQSISCAPVVGVVPIISRAY